MIKKSYTTYEQSYAIEHKNLHFYSAASKKISKLKFVKKLGTGRNRTAGLSHPKRESCH